MSDTDPPPDECPAKDARELRLLRRETLLAELAEARALRNRVRPRRTRLAREAAAVLRAAILRR